MIYRLLRDRVGIRTPNLLIRSEVLYPVELHSQKTVETGGQRYQLPSNLQMQKENSLLGAKNQRAMAF